MLFIISVLEIRNVFFKKNFVLSYFLRLKVNFVILIGIVENDYKFCDVNDFCDFLGVERGVCGLFE